MFSVRQKREIADAVQRILRNTEHPELPVGEIQFELHVDGAESWSYADIRNNESVTNPDVNPFNEKQDKQQNKEIDLSIAIEKLKVFETEFPNLYKLGVEIQNGNGVIKGTFNSESTDNSPWNCNGYFEVKDGRIVAIGEERGREGGWIWLESTGGM